METGMENRDCKCPILTPRMGTKHSFNYNLEKHEILWILEKPSLFIDWPIGQAEKPGHADIVSLLIQAKLILTNII